jgi:phosphoglycerate dehydrogenase-like enzyme
MSFRIGYPREYLQQDGTPMWSGMGREGLEALPGVEVEFWPDPIQHATPERLSRYDAVVATSVPFTEASFAGEGAERLAIIARYGVGYDAIDLAAATRAGVLVTITKGAADRPVAEGALTLMLSLGHQVVRKDHITRSGDWSPRNNYLGVELREKVIGILGFGGIGRELARLLQPFGAARLLAYDPYPNAEAAAALGVEYTDMDTLLCESDFLSIHCLLSPETRGLISDRALSLMKPTAFLINTSRGPVVDQPAITRALQERRIRGAALDVFTDEPIDPHDPLLTLENAILTPHHIAVTEEMNRDYHRACVKAILAVRAGRLPEHVVNPEVLTSPALERKLARLRDR